VAAYCSTGVCTGPAGPSGSSGQDGADGADGEDGVSVTDEQIATAVANYCSTGACTGPTGAPGEPGPAATPPAVVFQRYNGVLYRCERTATSPAPTYDCAPEPDVPADP
jgi:hypothetical protein